MLELAVFEILVDPDIHTVDLRLQPPDELSLLLDGQSELLQLYVIFLDIGRMSGNNLFELDNLAKRPLPVVLRGVRFRHAVYLQLFERPDSGSPCKT